MEIVIADPELQHPQQWAPKIYKFGYFIHMQIQEPSSSTYYYYTNDKPSTRSEFSIFHNNTFYKSASEIIIRQKLC